MKKIYRLTPSLKDNLWGGNKLRGYGKITENEIIAVSWELSFTKGGVAETEDGIPATEAFPRETWGENCRDFEFFPVLTKFIDAREKLSVQVHPSDEYALENEGEYGKTEMWYVVEAEEGAGLYMGLKDKCTPELFKQKTEDGTVEELLSFKEVKKGDVFFIPSGTIHAIGSGTLIFEIQQNSTLTYRLYDYQRRDKSGKLRELHVDKAMAVANLDVYEPAPSDCENSELIGKCKYFETSKCNLEFTSRAFLVDNSSFLSITATDGEGYVEGEKIKKGDTFFCPAGAGEITVSTDSRISLIAVRVP